LETFKLARKLRLEDEHYAPVGHLAFSPNEPLVAVTDSFGVFGKDSRSAIISIWNYEESIKVLEFKSKGFWLGSLAFSSDGTHLASGCDDGKVRFWDIQSRELTREVKTQREDCTPSVKPLAEGRWVIFSKDSDGDLLMWESETGGPLSEPVVFGKG
jgi:WD40 repeat protein